jgi:hypothetical protein
LLALRPSASQLNFVNFATFLTGAAATAAHRYDCRCPSGVGGALRGVAHASKTKGISSGATRIKSPANLAQQLPFHPDPDLGLDHASTSLFGNSVLAPWGCHPVAAVRAGCPGPTRPLFVHTPMFHRLFLRSTSPNPNKRLPIQGMLKTAAARAGSCAKLMAASAARPKAQQVQPASRRKQVVTAFVRRPTDGAVLLVLRSDKVLDWRRRRHCSQRTRAGQAPHP